MGNIHASRIESLRSMMQERGWDVVIITGSDPHMSEYPAERWKQVQWLTGFTGEAADVVITQDHAGLWTDTRYFIQAVQQLEGTGVELHKTRIPEQVLIHEWLANRYEGTAELVIAVDGLCMADSYIRSTDEYLKDHEIGSWFVSVPDLLGTLWTDRPCIPQTPIFSIDPGQSREERLDIIRNDAAAAGCDAILLSALDDIAWVLNVRASDIEYNPMVISYLLVLPHDAVWFVLKEKVEDPDTEQTFAELDSIRLERYDSAAEVICDECADLRLAVDSGTINFDLSHALETSGVRTRAITSPVQLRKAVKNPAEIEGMKRAHLLDGVAMEKFLYWLEKSIEADKEITEWDASVKLGHLRSETEGYRGDSFETISASGEGAALPHYMTPCKNAPVLKPEGLYLNDSGGQYDFGTTDITRTVPLGPCTELEREDYTLVLKAHIDLAMAVFPAGTPGCRIDALAREALWKYRRNFGHGTGHGVGYFLGVHEGPQDIRQNMNDQPLTPGMITSDEPGIYREGLHGVRHENLVLCVEDEENEFGRFLRFEPLTLCHFDTTIIEKDLLDRWEIDWLNDYNQKVFETLSPLLGEDVAEWLRKKTEAI